MAHGAHNPKNGKRGECLTLREVGAMEVIAYTGPLAFRDAVLPVLLAREAENTILLGGIQRLTTVDLKPINASGEPELMLALLRAKTSRKPCGLVWRGMSSFCGVTKSPFRWPREQRRPPMACVSFRSTRLRCAAAAAMPGPWSPS